MPETSGIFSTDFLKIMRNTLATSIITLLFSFPLPIILAVLLNEVKNKFAKSFVQTATYLPYFISRVTAANIFLTFLSSDGVINHILMALGVTDRSIQFFQHGPYFWWILAFANAWKKITHITLPAIKGTIIVMLILAIGGVLNTGYEQQLLMANDSILDYSDVLDTYAYRYGLRNGMYSCGTAVGLFKSIVSFNLVMGASKISKRQRKLKPENHLIIVEAKYSRTFDFSSSSDKGQGCKCSAQGLPGCRQSQYDFLPL